MRRQANAPRARSVRIAVAAATALLALSCGTSTSYASVDFLETLTAEEVQKHSADLHGFLTSDKESHYYYEWGETQAYGKTTPLPPGIGLGPGSYFLSPVTVSGLLSGTVYHYRLVVTDPDVVAKGGDVTFTTLSDLENIKADPATAISDTGADLNGSFDSTGEYEGETRYYFEWGASPSYGNVTPALPGGSVAVPSGRVEVPPATIGGLEGGVTYHYRLVVVSPAGKSISPDATFKTAEAPVISNLHTSNVTANGAELHGDINPRSGQTSYRFEWGPTASYGNSIPVPDGDAGAGIKNVAVTAALGGLDPAITYHFRLVATNQYGTTASPDQSFGFYPPACPNSQTRQETRSNTLPDCRAYELVTPSFAYGATIMPAAGPTSSVATNPARLAYGVTFGLFDESTGEGQNSYSDAYVSTRTSAGWTQRYVGLQGGGAEDPPGHGIIMGGPLAGGIPGILTGYAPKDAQRGVQGSPSLDRLLNYNWGYPGQTKWVGTVASNAPYVWDTSSGKLLERWPNNFDQVPGGEHFVGVPQASFDFTHLVFSSNVVFAEGGESTPGEISCCGKLPDPEEIWPPASIYDYEAGTGEIVLASRREDGTSFQGRVFDVSADGSHILMSEKGKLGPSWSAPPDPEAWVAENEVEGPLYLRVDATQTFEIAPGRTLEYAASTADGTTVYLASNEQLTPDDHDSSRDLFVWHQSTPDSLTRVSIGDHGAAGDTDGCSPVDGWIAACGASVIHQTSHFGIDTGNGHSDSYMGSQSGDLYFESPEQLVGNKGNGGERNIYLYRDGSLRYVATLGSNRQVARIQVTPSGRYLALTTASNLTDYDSAGRLEMYLYDAETDRVSCVSCRPNGKPPVSDVKGSQNGLFLTDDGRAFFSTLDPLVARDTNEEVDVYEYTEGRAQLITSGLGPGIPLTGGLQQIPGLVNVSANGIDAYFASTDVLVTQDHNGSQLKIYDARTGGGFPAERETSKCTAADECHGPSSVAPILPPDRTSTGFGTPAKPKAHKKKQQRKKKARKHKKKKRATNGKRGGRRHG